MTKEAGREMGLVEIGKGTGKGKGEAKGKKWSTQIPKLWQFLLISSDLKLIVFSVGGSLSSYQSVLWLPHQLSPAVHFY